MAGLFKKIFSFGRKEVETVPGETSGPQGAVPGVPAGEAAFRPDEGAGPPAPVEPAGGEDPTAAAQTDAGYEGTPDEAPAGDDVASPAEGRPEDETTPATPAPEPLDSKAAEGPLAERLAGMVEENLESAAADEAAAPPQPDAAAAPSQPEEPPAVRSGKESAPPEAAADDAAGQVPLSDGPAGGEAALPPEPAASPPASFMVGSHRPATSSGTGDAAETPKLSWFQRLRRGLSRTSSQLTGQITGIFTKRKLDEDTLQDLEDVLIQADLGVETAMRIADTLASGRYGRDVDAAEVTGIMAAEIEKVLAPVARPLELDLSVKPHVILVVGVNGTGKTTTIGKLAAKLTRGGLKVTLAAGDTFRAAAIEQLGIWGERTGSEVVASKLGADAAGLAYDAFEKARANNSDVLIIDTAGRLQNKAELMSELEKIVRVLGKHDPDAPHTVLQTLDATTGQNALNQVEIFRNVAGVNGLVMTKLDGTARGGILVAISARHKLPVYFIGVGEGIDDLEPFEAHEFAGAIAGTPAEA